MPDLTNPDLTVSPDDGMWLRHLDEAEAAEHYHRCGREALHYVQAALFAAGAPPVRRILDLPCGHGRILRHLKAAYPTAEITACDLERLGVDFCAAQFGAVPVYSHQDPDRIPLDGPFDLIWCGSLFTHLDARRWDGFLRRFRSLLSDTGVCVFTSHGVGAEEIIRGKFSNYGLADPTRLLRPYQRTGFAFEPYKRGDEYGISMANLGWIAARLAALPPSRIVSLTERAWDNHHDVIAFGPRKVLPPKQQAA